MTNTTAPIRSLSNPDSFDFERMNVELERERAWYKDAPRFETIRDIGAAYRAGELVRVFSSEDIRLIARFEEKLEGFWPYLTPRANAMKDELGRRWRDLLWEDYGIHRENTMTDMLASTSMVRSMRYQRKIIAVGKLSSPDSNHCRGESVDFDDSGYYTLDRDSGIIYSRSHPGRAVGKKEIREELREKNPMKDEPVYDGGYDPRINEAARRVAEMMHSEGKINLVKEFQGTPNACLHMTVSPDYELAA